jgi:hypothetical protein
VGGGGPPGRVRADLAARAPGASHRSRPHQQEDGAPGGGPRPRSRAPQSGAGPLGRSARRLAAARRVGGARHGAARLRCRASAAPARWPRAIPR